MAKEIMKDDLRVFVVPVEILDYSDLDIYEQMAYIVLRSFANARDNTAFPSYETIAQLGRMSRRKAISAIDSLIDKGLVTKESRMTVTKRGRVRNTSNIYTIKRPSQVVHNMHQPSVQHTPTLVNDVHHPDAHHAPEKNHLKESFRKSLKEQKDVPSNSQSVSLFKVPTIAIKILERNGLTDRLEDIETVYASIQNEKDFSDAIFIQTLQKDAVQREASNKNKSGRAFQKYMLKAVMNNIKEHAQFEAELRGNEENVIQVDPENDDPVMAVALPVVQRLQRKGFPVSLVHQFAVEAIQDTFEVPTWTEAKLMFKKLNILNV